MAQVKIPTFKLNDGRDIPALGYGTWLGLNETKELYIEDLPRMVEALSYAIDIGYRHIDTAHVYRVEPEVGEVINRKIREGVVKREDIFLTTKVWNHYHREADVEVAVRGSLRRLNLEYLDLIIIHWPMSVSQDGVDDKIDYLETWRGMEAVLKKGLTKSIGVSNFNVQQLQRLLAHCKIPPVCNQVEFERGITSIPKTLTKSRVLENASIFDFALDEDDTAALKAFDNGYRTSRPVFWQPYENYPFDKLEKLVNIPLALLRWKNGVNADIE